MIWFEEDHVRVDTNVVEPYTGYLMYSIDQEDILDKMTCAVIRCDYDDELHLAFLHQLKRVIE